MPSSTDSAGTPGHRSPSRRAVLAAGSLAGGAVVGCASPAFAAGRAAGDASGTGPSSGAPAVNCPDSTWRQVLDAADLVWQKLPATWDEGPFLGNGYLGTGVYAEPGAEQRAVRFTVQHTEVQDHRPEYGALFGLSRLPIGHFTLEPRGTITGIDWRLALGTAELTGIVTTTAGSLRLRALVESTGAVLAVEVTPSGGERGFAWVFHPAEAVSPRVASKTPPPGYAAHPPAVVETHGKVTAAAQALTGGGRHVTAWSETSRGSTRTLYATVAHSHPGDGATQRAVTSVQGAALWTYDSLARTHRDWWARYYRKSFVSLPDARLQGFYWIQLYKAASAARRDAPVMATTGPWLEPTPWPATWWNLNVQLEYWLIHGSNHLELDAVTRALSEFRGALARQVSVPGAVGIGRTTDSRLEIGAAVPNSDYVVGTPGQSDPVPEVGNLTWALHNVWLSYRHTMDESILRDTVFPLLRGAVAYYLHFLTPGADGKLHLPLTFSPEYGNAPDCNFDLMLLRWGCRTLLEAAELLGVQDASAPRWREVLARLTPYPVDDTGLMIGAGVPLAVSHRHFSHLLAVYPLYEITGATADERALIERSLAHWVGFTGALQGYTFTGAASISALLGKGDDALTYLRTLMDQYIKANTMYEESGPVIETPLAAAQSLHDMLCQSWGGGVRLFPAFPDAWQDAALHDFRAQGAFLVSAVREKGATRWVRIHSEAGAECVVRHGIAGPVTVRDERGRALSYREHADGTVSLDLRRGSTAYITARGDDPDFTVRPVASAPEPRWGLPA